MIVKNEEHCIKATLESVYPFIDYYVISDTGSTDNTKKIIKDFFDKKGINGEIYNDVWVNFGHNRTIALRRAQNKCVYTWVIDADDIIVGNLIFPDLNGDCYMLKYDNDSNIIYYRMQIFKSSMNWFYSGVLHEYPDCNDKYNTIVINGEYYIDSRRLGSRNKDANKYANDAMILLKDLSLDPNNERNIFYLAQSYYDNDDMQLAYDYYQKRSTMGGYQEEIFYSLYRMALIYHLLHANEYVDAYVDIKNHYLYCFNKYNHRVEPLYQLIDLEKQLNNDDNTYHYSCIAVNIPFPVNDALFIETDIYNYKIAYYFAVMAYYQNEYIASCKAFDILYSKKDVIPVNIMEDIDYDSVFAFNALKTIILPLLVIYLNCYDGEINDYLNYIIPNIAPYYHIIITGKHPTYIHNQYNISYVPIEFILECDYLFLIGTLKCNIICNNIYQIMFSSQFLHFIDDITLIINNITMINNINRKALIFYDKNDMILFKNSYIFEGKIYYSGDQPNMLCFHDIFNNNFRLLTSTFEENLLSIPEYYNNNNFLGTLSTNKILKNIYNEFPCREFLYQYLSFCQKNYDPEYIAKLITKYNIHTIWHTQFAVIIGTYYYDIGEYQKSYDWCTKYYSSFNDKLIDKNKRLLEDVRDKNIDHLKEKYINYPELIIDRDIINKNKNRYYEYKIMLSVTTCKRLGLFKKSINSFINCCLDLIDINYFLCVDDNSNENDRKEMESLYPFFEFIWKRPHEKGHYKSMNIIRNKVIEYNIDYLIHIEDDFLFVQPLDYVGYGICILNNDDYYGQVMFNRNYGEIEPYRLRIDGGIMKTVNDEDTIRYLEHEYFSDDTWNQANLLTYKNYDYNVVYWPHYSFQPSIIKTSAWLDIGAFYSTNHFEFAWAKEYSEKGYKTCFFDEFCCIHIGKKTWEPTNENAYTLNNQEQFKKIDNIIDVYVISYDIDNWISFKNDYHDILPNMQRICIEDRNIYHFNNLNDANEIIKQDLSMHLTIWNNFIENDTKFFMVTYDYCSISNYNDIIEHIDNYDIVVGINGYVVSAELINRIKNDDIKCNDIIDHLLSYGFNSGIINDFNPKLESNVKYVYYPQLDSYGYDYNKYCQCSNNIIVGHNSIGYKKYLICDPSDFITLDNSNDGLYVNTEYLVKIDKIKEKIKEIEIKKSCEKSDITFTITSGGRLLHFIDSINNFIYYCDDLDYINEFICIDDGSTEKDRKIMQEKFPFIQFIFLEDRNHAVSLNKLFDTIKTTYCLHYEDDWRIDQHFEISSFINFIQDNNIDQITWTQYGDQEHIGEICEKNVYNYIYNPQHIMKPAENRYYDEIINISSINNNINDRNIGWWWPNFSLNPSVMRIDRIKNVGRFLEDKVFAHLFEYDFSLQCHKYGIKVCQWDAMLHHTGFK